MIAALLSLFFGFNYDSDYCQPKWFLVCHAFILVFCYQIYQYSVFGSIFAGYSMLSALYVSVWIMPKHFAMKQRNAEILLESLRRNFYFICLVYVCFLTKYDAKKFLDALTYCSIVGALLSIKTFYRPCKRLGNQLMPYLGFSANSSVSGSFASLLAIGSLAHDGPMKWVGFFAGIFSVLRCGGSAGCGALYVGCVVYFSYLFGWIVPVVSILAIWPVLLLTKRLFKSGDFFCMSYRDKIWKIIYYEIIKVYWNRLFGICFGTFQTVFVCIQINTKNERFQRTKQIITWAHNDIYQILVEGGIIGIILLIFFITEISIVSWHNPVAMALFSAFLVNSLTNFPMRMAPDSALFMLFCHWVYFS